jgi:hypothetical protein
MKLNGVKVYRVRKISVIDISHKDAKAQRGKHSPEIIFINKEYLRSEILFIRIKNYEAESMKY